MIQTIRTLIADDDTRFRQRVRELLTREPDIEVVGEAADGREAIRKARVLKPDLVLMDVRMPGLNGMDTTRQLVDEMPEIKVIMLTVFDEDEYRQMSRTVGASGYVVKKSLFGTLAPAIRDVYSGKLK